MLFLRESEPLTRLDNAGKPCELIRIFGNVIVYFRAGSQMSELMISYNSRPVSYN